MNYKMFFIVVAFNSFYLTARHYESMFSQQWGQWEQALPAFSLEKSDIMVLITVNTGKKVTADDIAITHKHNRVMVDVKGLEHTLTLNLEANKHALGISMCTRINQEKKSEQEFSSYQGSSCMQQMMTVGVDLAGITAEYSGTKLVLSIPLVKEELGKKIPVVVKDEIKPIQKKASDSAMDSTTLRFAHHERTDDQGAVSAIARKSDGRKRIHEK